MPDDEDNKTVTATLSVTTASTEFTVTAHTDHSGVIRDYPKELLGLNRRDLRAAMKKRGMLYKWKWDRLGYL